MKIHKTENKDKFALPVSFSQGRLWFLEMFEPNTALYNIPFIATIKGSVHRDAFNRAVKKLIQRHEVLRTYFTETEGQPAQVIHEELTAEVDFQDLSSLAIASRREKLQEICKSEINKPFDLQKAPLFRIMLVTSGRETTIISVMHHIISDGWSIGIFQRDLSALYKEEIGGGPASLPEIPLQYADYAVWQRQTHEGESVRHHMEYWSKQLEGANTVLEIPTDYPRPVRRTFNGDVYSFKLPADLSSALNSLAEKRESTLFMTLLSAFSVLLYRLTAQEDLLVGTPLAGRKGTEVENLIGFFVNTLVLRARLSADLSYLDLLAQVKKTTLEAYDYQDTPFEKLVLELNLERHLNHNPLVQVLFALQNIPSLENMAGNQVADQDQGMSLNLSGNTNTAKFDFSLFVSELKDTLQCAIEFNTDLFSAETIKEISGYFCILLTAIVENPQEKVNSLPLLNAEQKKRYLESWTNTHHDYSTALGCHQLFENQCLATPDRMAVSHRRGQRNEKMCYAELNSYANQIAHYLISKGVKAGDNVGICMTRSINQIAVLLAIVKAGAAYVPLDPEYPQQRLRFILDDIGASVVISSADTRTDFKETNKTIVLEQVLDKIEQQSQDNVEIPHRADATLYIVYTSGSTGRPKGVVMAHRAIVNLVEWQARSSAVKTGTVTLQYASLNFDVATQEIFSTLTSAGCLQLVDDEIRRDSHRLVDYLTICEVSRLFLPPVSLQQLVNTVVQKNVVLDKLQEVIVAGEKLQITDNCRLFFEKMPDTRLVNQYGPSESHVVSAQVLDGPASAWPTHPPIGKPIDNSALYLLDDNLQPVPEKVPGELYIGGVSLAKGYLNSPELTAERFITNPFKSQADRLYRTGDLCRYQNDGTLEFIARVDEQIKLRGFRIEPGEVEVALKSVEDIDNAVVVKQESILGEDQLVAYLIAKRNTEVDTSQLRHYLDGKLPAYMIPTQFVVLNTFPTTPSGKIDRLRLPKLGKKELDKERIYVAARTPMEEFFVNCWCDLLQLKKVGISDNFFNLGGHSLSATQLVSRVRDEFSIELPLYSVFEHPTIEALSIEVVKIQALQEEQVKLEDLLKELESLSEEDSEALLYKIKNNY